MNASEILGMVWSVVKVITVLPIGVYNWLSMLLPDFFDFMFISNDNVWWHNLILVVIWLGLYAGLCILLWKIISGQCAMQMEAVEERYDVPLYPAWVVILYLCGIAFPFIVQIEWLTFRPWAAWFALCFPAIPWIYYLIRTGFGIFSILLRQIYVAVLVFIFLGIMALPAILAAILCLFGLNLFEYFADLEPISFGGGHRSHPEPSEHTEPKQRKGEYRTFDSPGEHREYDSDYKPMD